MALQIPDALQVNECSTRCLTGSFTVVSALQIYQIEQLSQYYKCKCILRALHEMYMCCLFVPLRSLTRLRQVMLLLFYLVGESPRSCCVGTL